ncbi:MAG: redoxin domain-containing protein [Myxococcota bacterium]
MSKAHRSGALTVICLVVGWATLAGCRENREPVPVEAEPPAQEQAEEPAPAPEEGDEPAAAGEGAAEAPAGEAREEVDEGPEEAEVGEPAPDFTLPAVEGGEVSLSDHRGETVVLEWYNPDCPFVKYAYTEGPLRDMAARHGEDGVVWLAINSGAPGKQGAGRERNARSKEGYGIDHPVLLDESGDVGRAYGATNTPQMVVVDDEGVVAYVGALDNAPLGKVRGDEHRVYVEEALANVKAGREVSTTRTEAYGCSVKYGE